jgi:cathepsin D
MGFLNTSLFTGTVEFTSIPSGQEGFWSIPMSGLSAQGTNVLNGTALAAIDTGTTLVGGPASDIARLFAQIPGSAPASGDYNGYWTYRASLFL